MQVSSIPAPSALGLLVVTCGCITSLFVLSSYLRYHAGRYKFKSHLGPCYLVLMSTFWTLAAALSFISVLIYGDIVGGWCTFNGITITLSTSGNLFGHTLIAFERYFLVIKGRPMSWGFIIVYALVNYILIFTALFIQLFASRYGFTPMEDRLWCFYNWTEPYVYDRIASVIVLLFAFGSMNVIIHIYVAVYLKTRTVSRRVKLLQVARSMSHLEQQVFYRCCIIIGSFCSFYTPISFFFFYRTVTGQHVSPWLDYALAMWTLFDGTATPLLVCYMSTDVRDAVIAYLPVKWGILFKQVTQYHTETATDTSTQGPSVISSDLPLQTQTDTHE